MFFEDVTGQEELKKQLTETARRGVVPHARLFCGADGNGGFQLAFAYARYLNCTGRGETDSCGKCPSCVKYNELAHPDLHFVFPIVSNKSTKKEVCDDYLPEWREFLKTQIAHRTYFNIDTWLSQMGAENKQAVIYAAESDRIIHKMNLRIYEADYRILFVWMPERMHIACANKLLKIIEEPPANTAILMITDSPDAVLGTIVSRSQLVQVRPVETDTLAKALTGIWNLSEEDAAYVAHLSGGNYFKATDLLTVENDNAYFLEQFKTVMRNGWTRNVAAMKSFSEEMASLGRERQKKFLAFCQRQIRENFVKCLNEPSLNCMNREEADFSRNFSPYVNERNVMDLMDELSLAERHIGQNVNSRMVFFDLSMRIIVLIKK
ncbi:MAG: DNA polymerase III subunit delta [Tannerella sp.]|jgi:DNA polymerase-3 subunit delta'|nr:DNA polymerase III subunit delta [Tannerella sp.]